MLGETCVGTFWCLFSRSINDHIHFHNVSQNIPDKLRVLFIFCDLVVWLNLFNLFFLGGGEGVTEKLLQQRRYCTCHSTHTTKGRSMPALRLILHSMWTQCEHTLNINSFPIQTPIFSKTVVNCNEMERGEKVHRMFSLKDVWTRMHSSRMRTVRCSGCLGRGGCVGGGVCLGGAGVCLGVYTSPPPVNRITDRCKNITFPQLHLRTVTA